MNNQFKKALSILIVCITSCTALSQDLSTKPNATTGINMGSYLPIDNIGTASTNKITLTVFQDLMLGHNASTRLTAQQHLQLEPGVNVQGFDAGLAFLDGLNFTNELTFKAGMNLEIGTDIQGYDAGLAFLDGLNFTNEATFKAGVNLEIGTDVQGYDVDLLSWGNITPSENTTTLLQNNTFADWRADLAYDLNLVGNTLSLTGDASSVDLTSILGSSSAGAADQVQVANGTGGFVDSGVTINAQDITNVSSIQTNDLLLGIAGTIDVSGNDIRFTVPAGNVNFNSNNLTNVGTINGVNIAALSDDQTLEEVLISGNNANGEIITNLGSLNIGGTGYMNISPGAITTGATQVGLTLNTFGTNGDITLNPNGTGRINVSDAEIINVNNLATNGTQLSVNDTLIQDYIGYFGGTDDQTLSFDGTNLTIEAGNSVDISSLSDGTGTDDQTASEVSIADVGNKYTATNVEAALSEIVDYVDASAASSSSGTYIPVVGGTNLNLVFSFFPYYIQVGSYVKLDVHGELRTSSTGATTVTISLPVATANFVNNYDASGIITTSTGVAGTIEATVGAQTITASFNSDSTADQEVRLSFMYEIQ